VEGATCSEISEESMAKGLFKLAAGQPRDVLLFFVFVVECGAGQSWGERGTAELENVKLFIT